MNYQDREKLKRLKVRLEDGYRLVGLYASLLNNCPELITKEMMDSLMDGADFEERDGLVALLCEAFSLERENPDDLRLIKEYLTPSVSILDTARYTENPYYKNVRFDDVSDGEWELKTETYPPYRAFIAGDMEFREDLSEIVKLGFFREEFSFPAVLENGNEWMTLTPVDVDTCDVAIERAFGKVVTFGLGLGYYAYMVSNKESVRSITVVEKSEKVISLFKKHVLPKFEHPEKVRIVNEDAFVYAREVMPGENYDYAFVDTWRDASDGAPMYKKMKALESLSKNTRFDYWLEGLIVSRIRSLRLPYLLEREDDFESYEDFVNEISWESLTDGNAYSV